MNEKRLQSIKDRCKWRGKHVSYITQWVYGKLDIDEYGIVTILHCIDQRNIPVSNEVIKDTLGQYVGHNDKDGNEIYEGDIILIGEDMYEVIYKDSIWQLANRLGNRCYFDFEMINFNYVKVIGNIYDNPELLNR